MLCFVCDSYAQNDLPILGPPENILDFDAPSNWNHGFTERGFRAIPENVAKLFAETLEGVPIKINFEVRPWEGIEDSLYISLWNIETNPNKYNNFHRIQSELDKLIRRSPNAQWMNGWEMNDTNIYHRTISIISGFNRHSITVVFSRNHPTMLQITTMWVEIH